MKNKVKRMRKNVRPGSLKQFMANSSFLKILQKCIYFSLIFLILIKKITNTYL